MGCKFRSLGNDSNIGITQYKPAFRNLCHYVSQKFQAIDPLILTISIWKMAANITSADCPQQGIAQGMGQHIRIGMSKESQAVRDVNPAKTFAAW